MNGAQALIESLLREQVDHIFGYAGATICPVVDVLKEHPEIGYTLVRTEQNAGHMASGYARISGKVGVCMVTSGPGATNLITGIATAYMDSIPVVAITGNVAVDQLGRDSFQEVDITGISMPVTKHNFIVKDIRDLAKVIRKAFRIAVSGRPGPVLIDVPKDITAQQWEYEPQPCQDPYPAPRFSQEDIDTAVAMLQKAKRPLLYAGGGVIRADAARELLRFAELLDCPVCNSLMGLGGFPGNHPLFVSMMGMHGSYEADMALSECDLIIAAGARFSDRVAGDRQRFGQQAEILHLDIDRAEVDKNVAVQHSVVGSLKEVLPALCDGLSQQGHREWRDQIEHWRMEHPDTSAAAPDAPPQYSHILSTLRGLTGEYDIIATDVGQHQMWTAQKYRFLHPRTFLTSGGLGTMGYGMGAAIGAQTAFPNRRVALVTGDGSFHMNLNELVTLSSYQMPIVVVLMNNTVLGMVRQWQKLFYGRRFSQTDPHRKTDFVELAHAFGVEGLRITREDQIDGVLKQAFDLNRPVVVDCQISPDDNVLPMIPPGGTTENLILEMD